MTDPTPEEIQNCVEAMTEFQKSGASGEAMGKWIGGLIRAAGAAETGQLREALSAYVKAQSRMADRWSEGDKAVKRELWQKLHNCEEGGRAALEGTDSATIDENLSDA